MEIAVLLLLLIVPLTAASPLRPLHRSVRTSVNMLMMDVTHLQTDLVPIYEYERNPKYKITSNLSYRAGTDVILQEDAVQAPAAQTSENTQEQHAQALEIIPFRSEDKHVDLEALKHR